jgi:uncharacterized protein (TIGR03437 family)
MRTPNRILVLALFAGGCASAQNPPVPAAFQETYTELQNYVANFQATINASWDGKKGSTLWTTELLNANGDNGLKLLTLSGDVSTELKALKTLGVKMVDIDMSFPLLYQPFYTFNGDPGDYAPMLAFFQNVVAEAHQLGIKVFVEAPNIYPGTFGLNVTPYYNSLSDAEFIAGRVQNTLVIAQQIRPDYINLNSEPQTEVNNTAKTNEYGNPTGYAAMNQTILTQLQEAGVNIPIGVGVDAWLNDVSWVGPVLALNGLGFFDVHTFPVNFGYLPNLIQYIDMGIAANIPVGIAQAWLYKESDAELTAQSLTTTEAYARDPFSFWAPLDQAMLTSLADFASWKNLLYLSPFWSRYFWAYLDYDQEAGKSPAQVTSDSIAASAAAIASNQMTSTASNYHTNVQSITEVFTLSAASFLTGYVAPESMVTIFGSNLSTGTASASSVPLPTELANTTATIEDFSGKTQPLQLIYVSPTQINAALPAGLANKPALITISSNGTVVAQSHVTLASAAPNLFTANQDGKGAPIGDVVTAHSDGSQTSVSTFQGSPGNYTPAPINLGGSGDQSVLVLYGTGIRGAGSLANVKVTIGNVSLPVLYAGPSDPTHFVAFDQVNVSLPQSLAGAGQVTLTLTVNNISALPVTLDFQ